MSTVREISDEYIKTVYELCIFLRLNGHGSLGERILTAALEVNTLSHITWSYLSQDGFLDNLVKTHEMAEKLTHMIEIVEYLDLGYNELDKIKEDTEAIYKMSRSSINTLQKNMAKQDEPKDKTVDKAKLDQRPTRQMREQREIRKAPAEIQKELADEGNNTTPESSGSCEVSEVPFTTEQEHAEPSVSNENNEEKEVASA